MIGGIAFNNIEVFYGKKLALSPTTFNIESRKVVSFIGPSGCGKSTLLRCINRMNDIIPACKVNGSIILDRENIYSDEIDVALLRLKVGMVFQKPTPFPKSIYENVAFGPRIHGMYKNKSELDSIVENSLRKVGLWNDVSSRLKESGLSLSGGQQQRLCIARAIAVSPDIILMDEPCSALDPIATQKIEDLILELKERYTIVIVTHSMMQAQRVSDKVAFFHDGKMIEYSHTSHLFESPKESLTKDYIIGKLGY